MKSKRRGRVVRGRVIVYVLASALVFGVICGLTSLYILLSATVPPISSWFAEEYTLYCGNENSYKFDKEGKLNIKKSDFEIDTFKIGEFADCDSMYVNFTALAEYCGFYVSGENGNLRYILPAADSFEETMFTVRAESTEVNLNGTTVHLAAPAVIRNASLYMPIEFVDQYIQGISVVADESREDRYFLLCSSTAEFYVISSPQLPCEPIDRTSLADLAA